MNTHWSECHTIIWGTQGGLLKTQNKKYDDMNIDIDNMSVIPHHNQ